MFQKYESDSFWGLVYWVHGPGLTGVSYALVSSITFNHTPDLLMYHPSIQTQNPDSGFYTQLKC